MTIRHASPCNSRAAAAVVLVLALAVPVALAEDGDVLSTDRPDFVESSLTVGDGVFQLETSVARTDTDVPGGDLEVWTTPTLFRYGIRENWELRLETAGYVRAEAPGFDESGAADIAIGAKWHTRDGQEGTADPSMAWLFHVGLETGSDEFSEEAPRPSVRGVAEWTLSDRTGLGVMGGLGSRENFAGDDFVYGIFGVVVGYAFTPELRGFLEFSAPRVASSEDGGNPTFWDAGVAWVLTPDWQVDAAVNVGASSEAEDLTVAFGLSGRFGR